MVAVAMLLLMTAIILSPAFGHCFCHHFFAADRAATLRQALLSRQDDEGRFIFYPLQQLILLTLGMTGIGAVLLFFIHGRRRGPAQHLSPMPFSKRRKCAKCWDKFMAFLAKRRCCGLPTSCWCRVLPVGRSYCSAICNCAGAAGSGETQLNLRPQENYDRLQLPIWLVAPLAVFMGGAALLSGWPASLSAALAAMIMAAYFLLGLAIIHAISRHWNGRGFLLAGFIS